MRAMTLMYPEIAEFETMTQQYMLGESLLTAAFIDQITLPPGEWIDFWTGELLDGPGIFSYTVPEGKGGPLFVKAGSLIPMWQVVDYVGQKSVETLEVHCYPARGKVVQSTFTLYEDDGETFAYQEGACSTTKLTMESGGDSLKVELHPRIGSYEGMPTRRNLWLCIHREGVPERILVDGVAVGLEQWRVESSVLCLELAHECLQDRVEPLQLLVVG